MSALWRMFVRAVWEGIITAQWHAVRATGGALTDAEIQHHIAILEERRRRLTERSLALSQDIHHWRSVLRLRAATRTVNPDEIGVC